MDKMHLSHTFTFYNVTVSIQAVIFYEMFLGHHVQRCIMQTALKLLNHTEYCTFSMDCILNYGVSCSNNNIYLNML